MTKIKTLFLAANPKGTIQLALDEEIREITQKIQMSEGRDVLDIVQAWAVRPDDLLQYLNQHKPQIVHFSGHGSNAGEIILVDNNGAHKPVSPHALKALFTTLKDNIQIVVLNACYSRIQGEAISEIIDFVIGMNTAIGDRAAIVFAASFYRALGFDRTIQEAFDQATTALLLEGIPEKDTPEILVRHGVSPHKKISADTSLQRMTDYDNTTAVAIRPSLMIVYRQDGWYLQNKGRGSALNIVVAQKLVKGIKRGKWCNPVRVPTLGAGEELHLNWLGHVNDTGLGASYEDEDGRPFTSVTGNDLTNVVRDRVIPAFSEDQIRRHWEFFKKAD
ncbi:MAG TPA: CHAT domain-containing protein [Pyrinomonadaceae bacterium]|nr:CHAT domain-containing protein [Pyrinomonadaceae bacterium]